MLSFPNLFLNANSTLTITKWPSEFQKHIEYPTEVKEEFDSLNSVGFRFKSTFGTKFETYESDVFICPVNIRFYAHGNFSNENLGLYLEEINTGEKTKLTNKYLGKWEKVNVNIDSNFIGTQVRLVAVDRDTSIDAWFAFSTPYFIQNEQKLLVDINQSWNIQGDLGLNCFWNGVEKFPKYLMENKSIPIFGSFCSGDKSQGIAQSPMFKAPKSLEIYMIGSFKRPTINLKIKEIETGKYFDLTSSNFNSWVLKDITLPEWIQGKNIQLILEDYDTQIGGWAAISFPLIGKNQPNSKKTYLIRLVESRMNSLKWIVTFSYFFIVIFLFYYFLTQETAFIYKYSFSIKIAFLSTISVLITCSRIPKLLLNSELNVDECQMISQAMKLNVFPIFWKDVDGTTGGPLLSYYLLFVSKLTNLPIDYFATRLSGLILVLITIIFLFFTLSTFYNNKIAYFGTFVLATFYAFATSPDFIHYSSEHLPVALISFYIFLFSTSLQSSPQKLWLFFLGGFLMALTPFSKLQCVYIFIVLGVAIVIALTNKKKELFSFILGNLLAIGLTVFYLWVNDLFSDFYTLYIESNLLHENHLGVWTRLKMWYPILTSYNSNFGDINYLVYILLSVILFNIIIKLYLQFEKLIYIKTPRFIPLKFLRREFSPLAIFIFLLSLVSIYSVIRSGRLFQHYLLILLIPLVLIICHRINSIFKSKELQLSSSKYSFSLLLICSSILIQSCDFYNYVKVSEQFENDHYNLPNSEYAISEEEDFIMSLTSPNEQIAIWGWKPRLYVQTRTISSQRDGISYYTTGVSHFNLPEHLSKFYKDSYTNDLTTNWPKLFIDATGKGNFAYSNDSFNHDKIFPELGEIIRKNYFFIDKIGDSRIYILNN